MTVKSAGHFFIYLECIDVEKQQTAQQYPLLSFHNLIGLKNTNS